MNPAVDALGLESRNWRSHVHSSDICFCGIAKWFARLDRVRRIIGDLTHLRFACVRFFAEFSAQFVWKDFFRKPQPLVFSQNHCRYNRRPYCSTDGRCTTWFPVLHGLEEARKVKGYQWGGVLQCKSEVHHRGQNYYKHLYTKIIIFEAIDDVIITKPLHLARKDHKNITKQIVSGNCFVIISARMVMQNFF